MIRRHKCHYCRRRFFAHNGLMGHEWQCPGRSVVFIDWLLAGGYYAEQARVIASGSTDGGHG